MSDSSNGGFNAQWGAFRKWIAKHPLTGFWVGVAGGVGVSVALRLVIG
jgi:hypothetical protein